MAVDAGVDIIYNRQGPKSTSGVRLTSMTLISTNSFKTDPPASQPVLKGTLIVLLLSLFDAPAFYVNKDVQDLQFTTE